MRSSSADQEERAKHSYTVQYVIVFDRREKLFSASPPAVSPLFSFPGVVRPIQRFTSLFTIFFRNRYVTFRKKTNTQIYFDLLILSYGTKPPLKTVLHTKHSTIRSGIFVITHNPSQGKRSYSVATFNKHFLLYLTVLKKTS